VFKREIKKIRELTKKLRSQGDVAEDEADYVYMIYRAVRIDAENVAEGFTEGDKTGSFRYRRRCPGGTKRYLMR